jgi:hypothetical protein
MKIKAETNLPASWSHTALGVLIRLRGRPVLA